MRTLTLLAFLLLAAALGAQLYLGAGVARWAAILLGCSAGLLVVAALAAFDALGGRAAATLTRRGAPVEIEDQAHAELLAAVGVCLHVPGLAAAGCDCGVAR